MPTPTIDRARDAIEGARVEQDFWEKNHERFLALYPDKFVAARDGEVLAADEDLQNLIQLIEAKGYDLDNVKVRFITANPRFLLL
jgi:hypothetical protein